MQAVVKNWLRYNLPLVEALPPLLLREVLDYLSPWQLYRSQHIFERIGVDTTQAWLKHCRYMMTPKGPEYYQLVHMITCQYRNNSQLLCDVAEPWIEEFVSR